MVEPIFSGPAEPRVRRPLLGYSMVLAATCMWGINGTVSKAVLGAGLSSSRLTEVRSTGAALALLVALAVTQPWRLRFRRDELLFLVAFGIFGLALVQWFYFFAIHRLQIGIALLIQYLAPVLIALWVLKRYAFGPIQKLIDDRRDAIRRSVEAADEARDEAQQLLEEHKKLIGEARGQAEAILAEARKTLRSDAKRPAEGVSALPRTVQDK